MSVGMLMPLAHCLSRLRLSDVAKLSGRSSGPTGNNLTCPEVSPPQSPSSFSLPARLLTLPYPDLVAEDWDEFPNGRWGDSRSPAYGDLDGYPVKIDVPVSTSMFPRRDVLCFDLETTTVGQRCS